MPQSIKMLSGDQSEAKWISGGTTCCSSLRTDKISPVQDPVMVLATVCQVLLSAPLPPQRCLIEFQNQSKSQWWPSFSASKRHSPKSSGKSEDGVPEKPAIDRITASQPWSPTPCHGTCGRTSKAALAVFQPMRELNSIDDPSSCPVADSL